jgi:hypothetical protein
MSHRTGAAFSFRPSVLSGIATETRTGGTLILSLACRFIAPAVRMSWPSPRSGSANRAASSEISGFSADDRMAFPHALPAQRLRLARRFISAAFHKAGAHVRLRARNLPEFACRPLLLRVNGKCHFGHCQGNSGWPQQFFSDPRDLGGTELGSRF